MSQLNHFIRAAIIAITYIGAVPTCLGQESAEAKTRELSRYELLVQYAKTNMELAEVELRQAAETNADHPGVIPNMTIERLRSDLSVAREQFQEAELASVGGLDRVRLRHAKEKVRLAELNFENGLKHRGDSKKDVLELKRLQLRYDLAKLNLALLNSPIDVATIVQFLQAKVDRMSEEILTLDQRVSKLEPIR